jgi:hypothetical protein
MKGYFKNENIDTMSNNAQAQIFGEDPDVDWLGKLCSKL